MPVMDGYSLCREWMRDEQLRSVPLVAYTVAYTDVQDERPALNLGATRYIVKPIEPDALVEIIEDVLNQAPVGRKRGGKGLRPTVSTGRR